jgi:hypothetical protein
MESNRLSSNGAVLFGSGFIVTPERAEQLGLGRISELEQHIKLYRNGRDLTTSPRDMMVIDLYGLKLEEVRARFPEVYQHVLDHVKPERDQNKVSTFRDKWWLFGRPRTELRAALKGLNRYIATVETSKYRFFVFLDPSILPDHTLVAIALDDAFHLGVLSSRIHVTWALAAGGILGPTPRYNKTRCFDPFPFPDCDEVKKARVRELGEELDAHRKRQQAAHPSLTITDMYNVLEKLRANVALNERERRTHELGLVSVLLQLHDELDAAVADAYSGRTRSPMPTSSRASSNSTHSARRKNAAGACAGCAPNFNTPAGRATQTALDTGTSARRARRRRQPRKQPWPKTVPEQARAVRRRSPRAAASRRPPNSRETSRAHAHAPSKNCCKRSPPRTGARSRSGALRGIGRAR